MAESRLDILITATNEAKASLDSLLSQLSGLTDESLATQKATAGVSKNLKDGGEAAEQASGGYSKLFRIASQLYSTFKALSSLYLVNLFKGMILEVANTAARAQVLDGVLKQVGATAGYTTKELEAADKAVQKMGITATSSRESLTKLIQAGLNLELASPLARASQDLAVVAGWNSSETFQRLVTNIQQMDTMGLRFMGLVINKEKVMADAQQRLGFQLDENTKKQIFANAVLAEATKLTGTYEISMGFAAKQLTSFPRYYEEIKTAIGTELLPAYGALVSAVGNVLKATSAYFDAEKEGGIVRVKSADDISLMAIAYTGLGDAIADVINKLAILKKAKMGVNEDGTLSLVPQVTDFLGVGVAFNSAIKVLKNYVFEQENAKVATVETFTKYKELTETYFEEQKKTITLQNQVSDLEAIKNQAIRDGRVEQAAAVAITLEAKSKELAASKEVMNSVQKQRSMLQDLYSRYKHLIPPEVARMLDELDAKMAQLGKTMKADTEAADALTAAIKRVGTSEPELVSNIPEKEKAKIDDLVQVQKGFADKMLAGADATNIEESKKRLKNAGNALARQYIDAMASLSTPESLAYANEKLKGLQDQIKGFADNGSKIVTAQAKAADKRIKESIAKEANPDYKPPVPFATDKASLKNWEDEMNRGYKAATDVQAEKLRELEVNYKTGLVSLEQYFAERRALQEAQNTIERNAAKTAVDVAERELSIVKKTPGNTAADTTTAQGKVAAAKAAQEALEIKHVNVMKGLNAELDEQSRTYTLARKKEFEELLTLQGQAIEAKRLAINTQIDEQKIAVAGNAEALANLEATRAYKLQELDIAEQALKLKNATAVADDKLAELQERQRTGKVSGADAEKEKTVIYQAQLKALQDNLGALEQARTTMVDTKEIDIQILELRGKIRSTEFEIGTEAERVNTALAEQRLLAISIEASRISMLRSEIALQRELGLLTTAEARARSNELISQEIELEKEKLEYAKISLEIAKETYSVNSDEYVKAQENLDVITAKINNLNSQYQSLGKEIRAAFTDTLANGLQGIMERSKSIKDVWNDIVNNVTKTINAAASKELAEQITKMVIKVTTDEATGNSIFDWLGELFGGKPDGTPTNPMYVMMTNPEDIAKTLGGLFGGGGSGGGIFESIGGGIASIFGSDGTYSGGGGFFDSILNFFNGYAEGGLLSGAGTGTSDSIPIAASNGEYIMTADQTRKWLPVLEMMRQGRFEEFLAGTIGSIAPHMPRVPKFAGGGLVTANAGGRQSARPIVQMTINTPDANSFRRSKDQIAAEYGMAVNRVIRRNR